MDTCIICKQTKKCNYVQGYNFCQNCKASYYIHNTNCFQYNFQDMDFKQMSVDSIIKKSVVKVHKFLASAENCASRSLDCSLMNSKTNCRFCRYRVALLMLRRFPKINKISMEKMKPLINVLNQNRGFIFDELEKLLSVNKNEIETHHSRKMTRMLNDNQSASIAKTDQIFRILHDEKPMHKYLRNNVDMNIDVYEIRSGGFDVKIQNKPKGFEKVQKVSSSFDGSQYSLNSSHQYAEFSLSSNDMKMTMSNNLYFFVSFLKKMFSDTAQLYFAAEKLVQITTELEKLFTLIFEEYQMLPAFCRLMASEDETMVRCRNDPPHQGGKL